MLTARSGVGSLGVTVSQPGLSHPPEVWAEMMVSKMLHVAEDAPQPIRDQALAFRNQLLNVAVLYITEAVNSKEKEVEARHGLRA